MKLLSNVAVNDSSTNTKNEFGKHIKSYECWRDMIRRCYDEKQKLRNKNNKYVGCAVCDNWLSYSNFKIWFDENYPNNDLQYQLDKDILRQGNKTYCPEFCRFVPTRINQLLIGTNDARGKYKKGVYYFKKNDKSTGYFKTQLSKYNEETKSYYRVSLGYHKTEIEAFVQYKFEKEKYVKEVAELYYSKGLIKFDVYESLMKWKLSE